MANFEKELLALLATEPFVKIGRASTLRIAEVDAIIAVLVKIGIPFDLIYSPGTRRLAAAAELTIHINPTTRLTYTINFEAGGSLFTTVTT